MNHTGFVKEVFPMKQVFEPVKLNHIELNNRLIRSATWEGIAARLSDPVQGQGAFDAKLQLPGFCGEHPAHNGMKSRLSFWNYLLQ